MAKTTPANNTDLDFLPGQSVSFSETRFDEFIHQHGIEVDHFMASKCPVGLIDQDDVSRRPHTDHSGCTNGFIYTRVGTLTVLFYGNSLQVKLMDVGRGDSASVQITIPRFYDTTDCGGENVPVLIAPFDRIFVKEDAGLEVVHWQYNEYHVTGIDRLSFPIKKVNFLMDSHGKQYYLGDDFTIVGGLLHWIQGRGPGMDPKLNKGLVYSIRYTYRPFYYVERLPHETRVAQIQDDITGERRVERMPQTAILQREFNYFSESDDRQKNASSARMPRTPASGSFGPR